MPAEEGTSQIVTKLFVWGNNDKCQLGMDNREDLSEDSAKEISVPHQLDPDPFQQDTEVDRSTLECIVASYYYSAALTSKGEIYTWGSGEFGRLGYIEQKKLPEPKLLKELKGHFITKVSLGYYHAAAINN